MQVCVCVAERGAKTALCTGDEAMTVSLSDVCVCVRGWVCASVCACAQEWIQGFPQSFLFNLQPGAAANWTHTDD